MDIKKRIDEIELTIKEMETNLHLDKINKEHLMRDNKRGGSGDVNNDGFVTEGDSKQILDFLVGKGSLDDTNKINAKVTSGNEKLGLKDIITIQREINNLSNEVNNIIPVSLVGKSLEVKDLSGERLDFKEIMAEKLNVGNRDISIDIQDLSRNLLQLKRLSDKDASFNSIITRNLDVSGALRVNGTNVLSKFLELDQSMNAIARRNILDLSGITQQYKEADAKILQDVSSAIQASAKEYGNILAQRTKFELQEISSNIIKGNILESTSGNFQDLDVSSLKVGEINVLQKINDLDEDIELKVSDVSGAVQQIKRQIKEIDDTVDVLKQSVSVIMGLLSSFLREQ